MAKQASSSRSLQIEEDMTFQRRNWFAERCAWAVMGLVLIAAAIGAFGGGGPLTSTSASDVRAALHAEYGRMQRINAPTTIKLRIAASAITQDGVALDVYNSLNDALKLTTIQPQPVDATALADRMRLRFAAAPGQDATIYFYVSPNKIGFSRLRLGLADAEPIDLTMLIYP
ncbi:MAG TPA: hypothetical protein VHG27_02770 [Xanthobacteraceae bacterium]|nr:hypothetical protein [Xanthobacteraceae bacterium]